MITCGEIIPFVVPVKKFLRRQIRKGTTNLKSKLNETAVAVIKLARKLGYKYEVIASYFVINQGRIADVMKGRIGPHIAPAPVLPDDFPAMA